MLITPRFSNPCTSQVVPYIHVPLSTPHDRTGPGPDRPFAATNQTSCMALMHDNKRKIGPSPAGHCAPNAAPVDQAILGPEWRCRRLARSWRKLRSENGEGAASLSEQCGQKIAETEKKNSIFDHAQRLVSIKTVSSNETAKQPVHKHQFADEEAGAWVITSPSESNDRAPACLQQQSVQRRPTSHVRVRCAQAPRDTFRLHFLESTPAFT
ncbi:hypothetical protein BKA66DRAFT_132664 [Pyrenochaeta sp. MPI-SDFR-AT-0127]|nr:hypothetical protein BKA66DRAFT_132664 [Pyrenochaeta sp. MPI-SDFR-AT-0127]